MSLTSKTLLSVIALWALILGGCSLCVPCKTQQTVLLLSNTKGASFTVQLCQYDDVQSLYLRSATGGKIPLEIIRRRPCSRLDVRLASVPAEAGDYDLYGICGANEILLHKNAVRVLDKIRIALSFDDGPAVNGCAEDGDISSSSTLLTLKNLDAFRHGPNQSKQGVKAIFFILSQPDKFLYSTYPKAETADGCKLLQETAKRGHLIGVHWGGNYISQLKLHTSRVFLPPYKYSEQATYLGENALQSDLLECIERIKHCTGQTPYYVRPPLWKYRNKKNPAIEHKVLETYKKLNLKMILTDARYPDGGYGIISFITPYEMGKYEVNLKKAFLSGRDKLVISMHDSNSFTARRLPGILDKIHEVFGNIEFGGVRADAYERIEFCQSKDELEQILQSKCSYVVFPSYNCKASQEERASK